MIIKISKKPKYILISQFSLIETYQYWIDKLDTVNKYCDVGVWKIKYKTQ